MGCLASHERRDRPEASIAASIEETGGAILKELANQLTAADLAAMLDPRALPDREAARQSSELLGGGGPLERRR